MVIIPYDDAYKEELARLVLDIQQNEFGIPITLEEQPDLLDIPGFFLRDGGNFWLALVDGRVAGCIALKNIGKGRAALRKMFVDARYRGRQYGIGQGLLDRLLSWAGEKNYKEILLGTTDKFLAAHRFYERNGFQHIPKDSLPQEFPVASVDSIFYRLALK
ncbi:MAG TPA: GNAT family N-acetyltransferase [Puia sp.]|nr:GNAT family N-acetyltransferase [Puia sp.]